MMARTGADPAGGVVSIEDTVQLVAANYHPSGAALLRDLGPPKWAEQPEVVVFAQQHDSLVMYVLGTRATVPPGLPALRVPVAFDGWNVSRRVAGLLTGTAWDGRSRR